MVLTCVFDNFMLRKSTMFQVLIITCVQQITIQMLTQILFGTRRFSLGSIFSLSGLLHNRIPATHNLIKRKVLQPNVHRCVGGCGKSEYIHHLFLSCDFFEKIWCGISNWLDFITVHPAHVSNHLLQFKTLGGFPKKYPHISSSDLAFMPGSFGVKEMLEFFSEKRNRYNILKKIKLQCFWWRKTNHINFAFNYHV